eukprot:6584029-Ditylum_brightwellii.AAC.1
MDFLTATCIPRIIKSSGNNWTTNGTQTLAISIGNDKPKSRISSDVHNNTFPLYSEDIGAEFGT